MVSRKFNVDKAFEFSFVRDPFSHFVSGYREAMKRTYKMCCNAPTQEGALPTPRGEWPRPIRDSQELGWQCRYDCSLFVGEGTKSLAKAVMSDILDLSLFHGSHWNPHFQHVALMFANILGERSWHIPDFIGRLESIGSDWDRMCALHGCPKRLATYDKLDKSAGQHPETSSDQYGHGAGLIALFEEEPRLKNAVRKLLRLDEDCLREHTVPASGTGTRRLRDAGDFIELDSWLER